MAFRVSGWLGVRVRASQEDVGAGAGGGGGAGPRLGGLDAALLGAAAVVVVTLRVRRKSTA